MKSPELIIEGVMDREGGYVNHPNDLGGETNFGIAKRYNPDVDIKNLTREKASQIYYDRYWMPSKTNKVPEPIREIYFDMVVNHGPTKAIKILQRACNNIGGTLLIDGKIGPKTLKVAVQVSPKRLTAYRVLAYAEEVFETPSDEAFYAGWFNRSLELL